MVFEHISGEHLLKIYYLRGARYPMKRFLTIFSAFMVLILVPEEGRSAGWGKFGVKGAYCTAVNGDLEDRIYGGGGAGVAVSLNLPVPGMALQPEVNLLSRYDYTMVEVPVNFQVGLDLLMVRPFVCVTPYFCSPVAVRSGEEVNRFQAGIGVGGGIDIWKFQIQCRYNWGITNFYKIQDTSGSDVSNKLRGIDLSLVFFF